MIKKELENLIKKTIKKLFPKIKMPDFEIEYPKKGNFGDYTTSVAIQLRLNAEKIVKNLPKIEFIKKIEVVPPGFINFYLDDEWVSARVKEITRQGEKFGASNIGKGKKVQMEFISANPTGPLTLGNGRGGFLGDALSKVLEFCGYKVEREYYINDTGNQIEILGHSVLGIGENLYKGRYVDELAKKIKGEDFKKVGEEAAKYILKHYIKKTIAKMGIKFDQFFSEKSLIKNDEIKKAIDKLKEKRLVYKKEDAIWFSSSKFGDDKDRVLVKQDGQYTYFASDIAYHLNKLKRGFDLLIDIWGADHHGDVSRMKAAAKVLGFENKLKFILHQFVRLTEKGKVVRMSKRTGVYITLDELINEVGLDATRYFFLTKAPETHLDFDLILAKEKSEKNPVYYIQYAAARCASILRKSEITTSKSETNLKFKIPNYKLLLHPAEIELIKQLIKFPDLIEEISQDYQIHKLSFYVFDLANSFHNFYEKCKVLDKKNPDLTIARLALLHATQIVLKNILAIMGIEAPARM